MDRLSYFFIIFALTAIMLNHVVLGNPVFPEFETPVQPQGTVDYIKVVLSNVPAVLWSIFKLTFEPLTYDLGYEPATWLYRGIVSLLYLHTVKDLTNEATRIGNILSGLKNAILGLKNLIFG